jgi:CubicO group peptidase (beta-lactamase class C family)
MAEHASCPLPVATPRELGFCPERIARVDSLVRRWTTGTDAPWPAASLAIGRRGRLLEPICHGRRGPEPDAEAVRLDDMFLIASLTKPITYLAGMLMVERGLLGLSEPVVERLPEFAPHGKSATLVQHLFTHTSGLPDMLPNNRELRRQQAPLERFLQHVCADTAPLFPPGAGFQYQSMGTLVAAELAQRASGFALPELLRRELFAPLGLRATGLGAERLDERRIVRVRTPLDQEPSWNWNSAYWRRLGAPWGGMFSTPCEYAALCQLMLNGGRWRENQIVAPATVRMMTTNRLDDLPNVPEAQRRTKAWGLGWQMNHPTGVDCLCDLLGPDAFGHIGATGTLVWCDPRSEAYCVIFTSAPRDEAPGRLVAVANAVAASLIDDPPLKEPKP